MKLTNQQIAQIKDQIGAEPVPAQSPATQTLAQHFGEHTFYVDEAGLHFFESGETQSDSGPCEVHPVRVATWTDEKREALAPHDPVVGATSATIDVDQ
jgi:hypothetical protein